MYSNTPAEGTHAKADFRFPIKSLLSATPPPPLSLFLVFSGERQQACKQHEILKENIAKPSVMGLRRARFKVCCTTAINRGIYFAPG